MMTILENVNAKVLGAILNRARGDGQGYGYYASDDYYKEYRIS